jgi:ribosomal protein S18 acetylase RimI-like enzyme
MSTPRGGSGLEIIRLSPDNAGLLDRVAEDVFDEPVRPDRLAAYLAEPGHIMLVAVSDGIVVGQCAAVVHRHPDKVTELYIDEVGVSPAFQRKGIARAMVEKMLAIGKELGCGEAWVGTEPDNLPARGLYERLDVRSGEAETFVMYVYRL